MEEIITHFNITDEIKKITPLEIGHINSTYLAEGEKNYILQKINKNIFKTPQHVVENFAKISSHMQSKVADGRRHVSAFKTHEGKDYFQDAKGDYWRLLSYLDDTKSLKHVTHVDEPFQAAKAYGLFQKLFLDFNPKNLHITIEDFHNPVKRLSDYQDALAKDLKNRADKALGEQEFIAKNKNLIKIYEKLLDEGSVPKRVVHNDAKLSNVLFDKNSGEGICVIDLDTVMPGFTFFDFGDLVRSMAGPKEDEKDLAKIKIDLAYFKALARGYLHHTKAFLTVEEKEHLLFGAKLIIYLLGIRFLTDYLSGDTYFKVSYGDHNLVRAQNQFKLLDSLLKQEKELKNILDAL